MSAQSEVSYESMRGFWQSHWSATKFAEEYQTNFYPRRQEEFEAIINQLPQGELVLEAGCSFGHVAEYFREQGFRVVGLDYVFDSLAAGHRHSPSPPSRRS
ncbi:MAG: class I SAM-dependent methyltransferase, partial [Acidobacteriota bacterium]